MATLKIATYPPDSILLRPAGAVARADRRVRRLIGDMVETMHAASGVGLAAPQVSVGLRVIVVDIGEGPIVLVNPEIVSAQGEETALEGCLSVPDLVGAVLRAERVVARGMDRNGKPAVVEGSGLLARALQHEIDHLDGILFIARLKDPSMLWRASELAAAERKAVTDI